MISDSDIWDARLDTGASDVHRAVQLGDCAQLERLIKSGKQFDARDSEGNTPLHYAGSNVFAPRDYAKNGQIAEILIRCGSDPNLQNDYGSSPLHTAASVEVARTLLSRGAEVNLRDQDGQTALHRARGGDHGLAALLIGRGAQVNLRDTSGETPLHCTVGYGRLDVEELLLNSGADVNARDNKGRTPLHKTRGADSVRLLTSKGGNANATDDQGVSPLHLSVIDADFETTWALIGCGADVNFRGRVGTSLFLAKKLGDTDLIALITARGGTC